MKNYLVNACWYGVSVTFKVSEDVLMRRVRRATRGGQPFDCPPP